MFKKSKVIAPILSVIFLSACGERPKAKYTYADKKGLKIQFNDYEKAKDRFILSWDRSFIDTDGQHIEIFYRGHFNKDSVDYAVNKYLEDGTLPKLESLK